MSYDNGIITIGQALEILIKIQNLENVTEREQKQLEDFWAEQKRLEDTDILDDVEYTMECSMCGKDTRRRDSGMCVSCDQVWNG